MVPFGPCAGMYVDANARTYSRVPKCCSGVPLAVPGAVFSSCHHQHLGTTTEPAPPAARHQHTRRFPAPGYRMIITVGSERAMVRGCVRTVH
ncbi:hypothetical protein AAHC03_0778 [Spirometra sp. Aus1]